MNGKFPISVVIITHNEAHNIERCLLALQWCSEVVVVDDHSTDDTRELSEKCGARVLTNKFQGFAEQRNWALSDAGLQHEWVLMLDADEVVTESLENEIRETLPQVDDSIVAFRMCRKTMFGGVWLKRSDGFPVWIMRLVKKGNAQFQSQGHGEVPVPDVSGKLGVLKEPFLHYPFSRGITHWIDRHNQYATREALTELQDSKPWTVRGLFFGDAPKRRHNWRQLSRKMPGRPLMRFLYQYLWKGGILEGKSGLTFSCLMAVYEWFIVLKKWEYRLERAGKKL